MSTLSLNQKIQQFYDQSTPLWLDVWGEHMHHGYYGKDGKERKDHRQAQIDMVKEVLKWGNLDARYQMPDARRQVAGNTYQILDVGCGVGGSSRLLAKLFDAEVLGLTLSPVQAKNAEKYTQLAGLQEQVKFRVQDMMTLNESDGQFDLIWSMESAEHIKDKPELLHLFYQLLKPGGKFLMVTWCHRDTPPDLSHSEQNLLQQVCNLYHLPPWISIMDYEHLAKNAGFVNVKTEDWSQAVFPFWGAVIQSAFTWQGMKGLLRSGWGTIKGAYAMRFMQAGFRRGIIKYGVIQGQKQL
ncbi:MAG: methyltransferase domain-containing protein [Saprospiraceae bacterium]